MANDKITMLKLKRMLQLLSCGQSLNFICSELHMSKRTVHNYKQLVSQTNLPYDALLRLSDFDLAAILQPAYFGDTHPAISVISTQCFY
jgi:hypothetical protein